MKDVSFLRFSFRFSPIRASCQVWLIPIVIEDSFKFFLRYSIELLSRAALLIAVRDSDPAGILIDDNADHDHDNEEQNNNGEQLINGIRR